MNEFLFYTIKGETISPNENVGIENCQVLGCVKAMNVKQAKKLLLQENPWICEAGFDLEKIVVKQVLTDEQKADIMSLIDYIWKDDEKYYAESNYPKRPIFKIIKRLKQICK